MTLIKNPLIMMDKRSRCLTPLRAVMLHAKWRLTCNGWRRRILTLFNLMRCCCRRPSELSSLVICQNLFTTPSLIIVRWDRAFQWTGILNVQSAPRRWSDPSIGQHYEHVLDIGMTIRRSNLPGSVADRGPKTCKTGSNPNVLPQTDQKRGRIVDSPVKIPHEM